MGCLVDAHFPKYGKKVEKEGNEGQENMACQRD
jgi:hypothetical protein